MRDTSETLLRGFLDSGQGGSYLRTRPGHVPGSSQGLELRQRAAPVHAARVAASQREREGPAARRHVPDRRPGPAWSRHVREVTDLKLSPANDHLVSASNDTTARVWRAAAALSTHRPLPQLDSPHRRRRAPHPQGPRLRHARPRGRGPATFLAFMRIRNANRHTGLKSQMRLLTCDPRWWRGLLLVIAGDNTLPLGF